jgi:hypothetical protein
VYRRMKSDRRLQAVDSDAVSYLSVRAVVDVSFLGFFPFGVRVLKCSSIKTDRKT